MNKITIETEKEIIEYFTTAFSIEDSWDRTEKQLHFTPSQQKRIVKKDLKAYAAWYIGNLGHTNLDFIHDCAPDFFDGAQLTAEETDKVIELINTAKVKVEWL